MLSAERDRVLTPAVFFQPEAIARVTGADGHLSFSFEGVDELEPMHGSGTAELQGEPMIFMLASFMGDAFTFVCERQLCSAGLLFGRLHAGWSHFRSTTFSKKRYKLTCGHHASQMVQ